MNAKPEGFAWGRNLLNLGKIASLVGVIGYAVYYVKAKPVAVTSHRVTKDVIVAEVMGTGTLEARVKATISPKISGRIAEVLVDQGQNVKSGQLLVRLDDDDLQQKIKIAEATIAAAQASVKRFEAETQQAASVFNQADSDYKRAQKLLRSSAISQSEFEKIREGFGIAKSGVARAEASLVEAKQQVELTEQSLKFDEARLADSRITAPFDGLIVERFRDPGSITVPGTPVLSLISLDELWISAWVDETEMEPLRPEQPARVNFRSNPKREFSGQVARLGKQADRETREFTVDVSVLELPGNWAIGQRAEVYIQTDRAEQAVVLPAEFVVLNQGQPGVYTLVDQKAHWQPIELGMVGRDLVQVKSGVTAGTDVVIPANAGAKNIDGRRVAVQ